MPEQGSPHGRQCSLVRQKFLDTQGSRSSYDPGIASEKQQPRHSTERTFTNMALMVVWLPHLSSNQTVLDPIYGQSRQHFFQK